MGEESWRIRNVGLSSLDLFRDNFFKSKTYLEQKFKIDLSKLQHLIISHISEKNNSIELALEAMNSALDPLVAFNGNLVVARQDEGFGWLEVK